MADLIPVNSPVFYEEQNSLRNELNANKQNYLGMSKAINCLVSAAIAQSKNDDEKSDCSDVSVATKRSNINTSLESIKEVDITVEEYSDDEKCNQTEMEVVPGLKELLTLMAQGRVKLTVDILQQLTEYSEQIKAGNKTCDDLSVRLCALETSAKEQRKNTEEVKQYIKFDNLLFHNFKLPPKHLTSLEFSCFMAEQINYVLPYLPVPVTWQHISDAHPLRTKSRRSNVIIVRFCNRNIRHMIYSNRAHLQGKGMAITEHLTSDNLDILNRAKELFGFKNVCSENCNILMSVNGKVIKVKSIAEVNEIFESSTQSPATTENEISKAKHEQSNGLNFSSYTRATERQNFNNKYKRYHSYPKPNNSHFNNYNYRSNNIRSHYPTHNGYSVRNRHY